MRQIGDFKLERVVESEEPLIAAEGFFPESTPDVFAEHAHWLQPRYVDPVSGKLVICVQSYIVRTPRHIIVVDACVGNDKERAVFPQWHHQQSTYLADLAAAGVRPEEVDFVMCTHLHTDHVGWNTRLEDGRWVPTFPNARYIFARDEYRQAEAQMRLDASAGHPQAFADSVLPVMQAGQAVLVDHDHEIDHGVWLEPAPGHTPGNVVVNLKSGQGRAVLSGDVIHHPVQLVRPEWSSRACEDRPQSRQTRRAFIERYVDTDTLIAPAHFPSPSLGYIVAQDGHFGYRDA
ncbi:MAG: MBL fold metallo-hydrolase [Alphaproteobacteria bacterium]|jgi:glyoxylase-like metal-dependent hydrolase (beta-lactamase superfamily II)|nr:MBL fold metallo-hydrolase [Alphaproteobacteria bacterium]|tara:strand:- start:164 stop:1033 length:870 start_codon:yes stop_codon:yes gene_type:complete